MGLFKGGALRLFQTLLFVLAFCAAGIVLGFYSYFLAVLSNRDEFISKDWKAVEGISGLGVLYTLFGILLTCCLGGITFFGLMAIILDLLFCGGFIAIAVLTRSGSKSCSGNDATSPLGSGAANVGSGFNDHVTYEVKYGTACKYNKASFGAAIAGAFLFLLLALFELLLMRNHKKEKAYGPGPNNNYTSGQGSRRSGWRNRFSRKREVEAGAVGVGGAAAYHHHEKNNRNRDLEQGVRPSNDTAFTGSTVNGGNNANLAKDETVPVNGGYYTAPAGTSTNY